MRIETVVTGAHQKLGTGKVCVERKAGKDKTSSQLALSAVRLGEVAGLSRFEAA